MARAQHTLSSLVCSVHPWFFLLFLVFSHCDLGSPLLPPALPISSVWVRFFLVFLVFVFVVSGETINVPLCWARTTTYSVAFDNFGQI